MRRQKATRPTTESVNRPRADFQAGKLEVREATPTKPALQHAGRLLGILEANLKRATEPELIARLRAAIDRLVAS